MASHRAPGSLSVAMLNPLNEGECGSQDTASPPSEPSEVGTGGILVIIYSPILLHRPHFTALVCNLSGKPSKVYVSDCSTLMCCAEDGVESSNDPMRLNSLVAPIFQVHHAVKGDQATTRANPLPKYQLPGMQVPTTPNFCKSKVPSLKQPH